MFRLLRASESLDAALVAAVSRSGSASEAAGGPLVYCYVLLAATLLGWTGSPLGMVSICQMAMGDGLADIIGRRWGSVKWPWSRDKSFAGSIAFVVGASVSSAALLTWYQRFGCFRIDMPAALPLLVLISVVCALAELVSRNPLTARSSKANPARQNIRPTFGMIRANYPSPNPANASNPPSSLQGALGRRQHFRTSCLSPGWWLALGTPRSGLRGTCSVLRVDNVEAIAMCNAE